MNKKSYTACQMLLKMQRKMENEHYHGWPGKSVNAPVETLYPNLVAEMGWGFPWLYLPAEFADVSKEIMAAVLEDNEELSCPELLRLARGLGVGGMCAVRSGKRTGCYIRFLPQCRGCAASRPL